MWVLMEPLNVGHLNALSVFSLNISLDVEKAICCSSDDISVLTPPPLLGRYRAHDYLQVFLAYWGTANSEASSVQLVVVCVAAATTA